LSLHLLPTGEVDNVYVVQSSGDSHFDDSAIRAVKRVGRFPELQKMDPVLFDRNFRKLNLEYKPSDLRR
jgi:colicin import membrane protein